jgi:threonine dehydrogenase-like Zn-dependent dehydrogenase
MEISGFEVRQISHVFGGQYLWVDADATSTNFRAKPPKDPAGDRSVIRPKFETLWRAAVEKARAEGTVSIWGAGAKGVMFALLVDSDGILLDHAIDINPNKQGLYLAGSGLEVLAPIQAAGRRAKTVFVMNPNYFNEIRSTARDNGISGKLVSV